MNEQSPLNEGSKGSSSPRKRGRKLAADVINRMVNAHRRRKRKEKVQKLLDNDNHWKGLQ